MVNQMRTAVHELHAPQKLQASDRAFDLFHHPHEADGVVVLLVRDFSPPSVLTDPVKPDGVAEKWQRSDERAECRTKDVGNDKASRRWSQGLTFWSPNLRSTGVKPGWGRCTQAYSPVVLIHRKSMPVAFLNAGF